MIIKSFQVNNSNECHNKRQNARIQMGEYEEKKAHGYGLMQCLYNGGERSEELKLKTQSDLSQWKMRKVLDEPHVALRPIKFSRV